MSYKRTNYLTWDEYFMGQAIEVSLRSKDPSTQVGACIASPQNTQISVGYNGLTRGMDDDEFPWNSPGEQTNDLYTTKNPWVVHAERNAILNSHGTDLWGATLYVTLFPCNECAKSIVQSGIKKVVYLRTYSDEISMRITSEMFQAAGIECIPFNKDKDWTKQEVRELSEEIQNIIKCLSGSIELEYEDVKKMRKRYNEGKEG